MKKRYLFLIFLLLVLAVWAAILLLPKTKESEVYFSKVEYSDLKGWSEDKQGLALNTFRKSCASFYKQSRNSSVKPRRVGGVISDWLFVCKAADELNVQNHIGARLFFEQNFTPLQASTVEGQKGLLTGYYEPIIEGKFIKEPGYNVPLYSRPKNLITVNLGLFRPDLKGRRVAGRVSGGQLRPFESRAEIEMGALSGKGLELIWLKDPIDAFFLHIQGSGRVRLPDGTLQMVGYSGPNGHPYTSLGGLMRSRGLLEPDNISMKSIKNWLKENPDRAESLMQKNASYVFFRLLDGEGPIGSQGVELTGGRSLAVDREELPLGAPIWLSGTMPSSIDPINTQVPFERLMISQDTGGAIKGILRGDVFWGIGEDAEKMAGYMANFSEFFILLPNFLAKKVLEKKITNAK
jgi:membrane-bound lytic murein transglycosylase A